MKPATISLISVIATLGTVAAIGFAQPDGIDPPAGPVSDTQPSLTSIDQKIEDIKDDLNPGPYTAVHYSNITQGTSETLNIGNFRLIRVIMQKGAVSLTDPSGLALDLRASTVIDPNGERRRLAVFSNELNIDIQTSLTITGTDGVHESDLIVVYKELP